MASDFDDQFTFIERYFRELSDVHPYDCTIRFGWYVAIDGGGELELPGGLVYPVKYRLEVDDEPIPVVAAHAADHPDYLDDYSIGRDDFDYGGAVHQLHIVHNRRATDVVVDNQRELRASGWANWRAIDRLSAHARREYDKNLADIKELPGSIEVEHGRQFIRDLAQYGTYDETGAYFPKWKDPERQKAPYHEHCTDVYLEQIYREVELTKGGSYLLLLGGEAVLIYRLFERSGKRLERQLYYAADDNPYRILAEAAAGPVTWEAVFFDAHDGTDQEGQWKPRYRRRNVDHAAYLRMADPVRMLEDASDTSIGAALGLSSDFDWFVEMVAAFFRDRFYVIDVAELHRDNPFMSASFFRAQVRGALEGHLDEVDRELPAGSPLAAMVGAVRGLLDDPHRIVLFQGLEVWEQTRFVGLLDGFAYMRDLREKLVTRLPIDEFVEGIVKGAQYQVHYERSAGILPLAELVWAIGGAVGVASAGSLFTATAVRQLAGRYLARKALNRLAWKLTKLFAPGLIAKLVELILHFFAGEREERWRRFARGFFHGYVVQTFYDHFHRIITDGISGLTTEVSLLLGVEKVLAAVAEIDRVVTEVRRELGAEAMDEGIAEFKLAGEHFIRGALLLLSGLYYAPHDDAEPITDALGKDGGEAPDRATWDDERRQQLASMLGATSDAMLAGDLGEALADQDVQRVITTGLAGLLAVLVVTRGKKKGKPSSRKPFVFLAAAAVLIVFAVEVEEGSAVDSFFDAFKQLIEQDLRDFPGRDPERAEIYGSLFGNLLGGFMLDRHLFGPKTKMGRFAEKHRVGGWLLKSQLKHGVVGPFLKVLLKQYVAMFNEMLAVAGDVVRGGPLTEDALTGLFGELRLADLDARGLGHLASFHSEADKALTLEELGLALLRVKHVLDQQVQEFIAHQMLPQADKWREDLTNLRALLQTAGVEDWVKANAPAMYYHFATHLRAALGELILGLQHLFAPFTRSGFSWITLIRHLGWDVGPIDRLQQALRERQAAELAAFDD